MDKLIRIDITCECLPQNWKYTAGQVLEPSEIPPERLELLLHRRWASEIPKPKPRPAEPPAAPLDAPLPTTLVRPRRRTRTSKNR